MYIWGLDGVLECLLDYHRCQYISQEVESFNAVLRTLYAWYGTYGVVSMFEMLYVSKRQYILRRDGILHRLRGLSYHLGISSKRKTGVGSVNGRRQDL